MHCSLQFVDIYPYIGEYLSQSGNKQFFASEFLSDKKFDLGLVMTNIHPCIQRYLILSLFSFQEAIGIVTSKVERNWHISETLFNNLDLDPDRISSLSYPVAKVKVVECPDEFVRTNMRVQIWKDDKGNAKRFQPINMKNPILGMSMSQDEGRTWTPMSQYGDTDSFLASSELMKSSNSNQTMMIRVESWMGGSNVIISSQAAALWTAGQYGSGGGNNIWRGILRFTLKSFTKS